MKYEDLVIACTVGTGTRPISRDLLPDPIAAALPAQDGDDDLALDAAAVWGLLRASRLPKVTPGEPVALPAETRPRLPASTASLLTRIAVDNAAHEFEALLGGLQELADRHGNTIALPDELLVALLERLDQARLARVLRLAEQIAGPFARLPEEARTATLSSHAGPEFASRAGYTIKEVHHWNFSKGDYPTQVFDPRNLVPTETRKQHTDIHRATTGDPSNIWAGPIADEHRLNIPDFATPIPPGYFDPCP